MPREVSLAGWLCAIDFALGPHLQLAIAGAPDAEAFRALAGVADSRFLPNLVQAGGLPASPDLPRLMAARPLQEGEPTAYLCQGFTCRLPTTSPEELGRQLDRL